MMEQDRHVGQQIGNYRLVEQLDCGSFGCVYRAGHLILKTRTVAVKILHTHLATQQQREGFFQEAELLEMLKHPHILPILDVGVQDGFPYLVTEYCPEGSLSRRLKRQRPYPLPLDEAITILAQVGQALQYVNEQRVVHRDLKPENILFNAKGEALLADFGIAKMLASIGIRQGTITGTPSYMAPEQFRGTASKEGDQYALGCIAYELLTGRQPFTAPDLVSMMYKHVTEQPLAPRHLNPQLPAYIEQAVLKAMAKERKARHADVATFITQLQKSAQQWLNEGDVLYDLRRYQEALAAYEQAIHLDPNDAVAYMNKGYALHDLERYQEALAAYEQAIHLDSNDAIAYYSKGNVLGALERYQEALAAYGQAIHLDPDLAIAYYSKGNVLGALGRYQEALAAFEQALRLNPDLAVAYNGKGNALSNLKHSQEALAAFEQALRLNPDLAAAYNGKGNTLSNLKRYQEALAAYEQAIRLDPNDALAYIAKGCALYDLKRYQEALVAYEQAIHLDPNYIDAYTAKGITLCDLERYQEALVAFEQALCLDPNNALAYNAKGDALHDLKCYQEALAAFEQAIRLDPNYADAYHNKGLALEALGKRKEAQQAYERARQLGYSS